jgi:integration host factor subunit beta
MIRSELVQTLIDENPALSKADIQTIVDTFFECITRHLENGGRAEIRGFGVFTSRVRNARRGRDPRNGETIDVVAKRAVHFRPGKKISVRLNR